MKRVLNTGSGPVDNRLHPCFRADQWQSIRLDIDPRVKPDLVGTIQDMRGIVPDACFDAVWSSHALEHLHGHEVVPALLEFRRVLRDDGFAFVTCPDLEAVASLLLERGMDKPVYISPAGPIAVADMIFGHRASVAAGNTYMAHNTGFTAESLGTLILEAGFAEVHVGQGDSIDLWAIACMPGTRLDEIGAMLQGTRQDFLVPQ
jgi:predicted SAM-dependent methyltransferase